MCAQGTQVVGGRAGAEAGSPGLPLGAAVQTFQTLAAPHPCRVPTPHPRNQPHPIPGISP